MLLRKSALAGSWKSLKRPSSTENPFFQSLRIILTLKKHIVKQLLNFRSTICKSGLERRKKIAIFNSKPEYINLGFILGLKMKNYWGFILFIFFSGNELRIVFGRSKLVTTSHEVFAGLGRSFFASCAFIDCFGTVFSGLIFTFLFLLIYLGPIPQNNWKLAV